MLDVIARMPEMLLDALERSKAVSLPKIENIRQIVFAGMGGSAVSGDIISDLLRDKIDIPIYVNRGYKLPNFINGQTLVIAISYSGNTEETLAAVEEASSKGAKIVCLASGGKLREKGCPLVLVPPGYQPRAALPYLLITALKVLESVGLPSVDDNDIKQAVRILQKLRKEIGPGSSERSNTLKQLAKKMLGKVPIILAAFGTTAAAGLRLKTQFNENSKITALYNLFPEMNHNEIVSLAELENGEHDFCLIFLRDEDEDRRVAKRMDITKSLIGTKFGGVKELFTEGKTKTAKILSLIYQGDLLSVYLAGARGIDPVQVDVITKLKRELAR
ncbi:MAG: bifunctional phosphoglucose/phosphomannose isomerase [Candidatus Margulisiibacteriota bacterium]|nr:bifunctional phosphoglucose/phosphomannose isomerase [Candidatus Margulisiibacteriota bacterium]